MTALELETSVQKERFTATIRSIRQKNFMKNLPFLILSEYLPDGQAYHEFPDGHIEIQEVYTKGAEINTIFIRTLTPQEADKVRKENGLF